MSNCQETEGGSVLTTTTNLDGSVHQTSYHKGEQFHYSQDVATDGTVSNQHWKDHTTGEKVGDRD